LQLVLDEPAPCPVGLAQIDLVQVEGEREKLDAAVGDQRERAPACRVWHGRSISLTTGSNLEAIDRLRLAEGAGDARDHLLAVAEPHAPPKANGRGVPRCGGVILPEPLVLAGGRRLGPGHFLAGVEARGLGGMVAIDIEPPATVLELIMADEIAVRAFHPEI